MTLTDQIKILDDIIRANQAQYDLDRVDKTVKYDNNLEYDSVHNFDKYSVPNFNEISSANSKFDSLNKLIKISKRFVLLKVKPNKKYRRRRMC